MDAAKVNLITYSDADFSRSFRIGTEVTDGVYPLDLTGYRLLMMVRKRAADAEVFINLSSDNMSEIDVAEPLDGLFSIFISRATLARLSEGEYVHSLLLESPTGLREDIWRGTLTHAIGPTR